MRKMFICGCSYAAGCGLEKPEETAYGVLVAKHFGFAPINIAKHAASNYCIAAQVKWAVQEGAEAVLIGVSTIDRMDWIAHRKVLGRIMPTATDFIYHGYYPFTEENHPFVNEPRYSPTVFSESMTTILNVTNDPIDFEKQRQDKSEYFARRFEGEPIERLKQLRAYIQHIYDPHIKALQDQQSILSAVAACERQKVRYYVLDQTLRLDQEVTSVIPGHVVMEHYHCGKYPDKMGTKHISEEGHAELAKTAIDYMIGAA